MKKIEGKITGDPTSKGKFFAIECNSIANELMNIVKTVLGNGDDKLKESDSTQVINAIIRLTKGLVYNDTSAIDNEYRLSRSGFSNGTQAEGNNDKLYHGDMFLFQPNRANTGTVTIKFSASGLLNTVVRSPLGATELTGGEIKPAGMYMLVYSDQAFNGGSDSFFYIYELSTHPEYAPPPKIDWSAPITIDDAVEIDKKIHIASAVFKKFKVGWEVAETEEDEVDLTDQLLDTADKYTYGIKRIVLVFNNRLPVNESQLKNKSINDRTYRVELSASPIDDLKYYIGFTAGDSHLLYRWVYSHMEWKDTGFAEPYNKRAVVYMNHTCLHSDIIDAMSSTGSDGDEDGLREYFQNRKAKFPDFNSFDSHYAGGGWKFFSSNFKRIPESLEYPTEQGEN